MRMNFIYDRMERKQRHFTNGPSVVLARSYDFLQKVASYKVKLNFFEVGFKLLKKDNNILDKVEDKNQIDLEIDNS